MFLLFYAKEILSSNNIRILIIDYMNIISANPELKEEITSMENHSPNNVAMIGKREMDLKVSSQGIDDPEL